ncbi:uncharacterized protein PAC_17283 [Phialocephala subalpina]|uniref:BHLH domain-containing protein n=1 Tax=Phialocephala subalpina TaxID=576137 RepID=A0A1L7XQR2_9HELO|nr:uncharacterized protein PAC_17283 [Phialocephala subalpina]
MGTSPHQDQERLPSAGYNYPAGQRGGCITSPQSDWFATPVLSTPDWPNDGQPGELYAASPISSPGISTPSNGDSWNVFDDSFRKSIGPSPLTSPTMDTFASPMMRYPQNASQQTWSSTWSPGIDSQRPASSYLPLSMIYDLSTACESGDGEETENSMYPYQSLDTYESPQSPRKAAWGSAKHTRRASESSKPDRHSTRSKRRVSSSRTESSSSPTKGHQLRSTKQGQRISYQEPDTTNDTLKGVRTSHNMVEKQYRTRLNGQFSTLLSALPPDVVGTEVDGSVSVNSGAEKRVSKAEVLVLAKKHIENLERTKKSLEGDKRHLIEDVQRLKEAWARMGGDVMP